MFQPRLGCLSSNSERYSTSNAVLYLVLQLYMPAQNVVFTKMTLLVNQVDASTISSISGDVKCGSHYMECYAAGLF